MEHIYLQQKYLYLISGQLQLFKKKNDFLYNFRCPYCGDSKKSKTKARGYIYKDKTGLFSFQCHNCGVNHKFKNFLKFINQSAYKEYIFEMLKQANQSTVQDIQQDIQQNIQQNTRDTQVSQINATWIKDLIHVPKLNNQHPAVLYLQSRKIPKDKFKYFWFTYNFADFAKNFTTTKQYPQDERLILIETNKFNQPKIIIARSIQSGCMPRYITLKIDESYPKIYGLSALDYTKPVFVVEGAIDSLFLDNCIATLDANLLAYQKYDLGIKHAIHIWDNEPRNTHICKCIANAITKGEKVVIFPEHLEYKDINNMVEAGIDVKSLIKQRTFSGIQAILEFNKWNKTNVSIRQAALS